MLCLAGCGLRAVILSEAKNLHSCFLGLVGREELLRFFASLRMTGSPQLSSGFFERANQGCDIVAACPVVGDAGPKHGD